MTTNFLRRDAACAKAGFGPTTLFMRETAGLFPQRVKITAKAAAWIESEVDAYNAAIAAGATDAQLKRLVRKLVEKRKQGAPA